MLVKSCAPSHAKNWAENMLNGLDKVTSKSPFFWIGSSENQGTRRSDVG
jgi:hypothetical protein